MASWEAMAHVDLYGASRLELGAESLGAAFGLGLQSVCYDVVVGFVRHREAEERAGVVPGDGADRVLRDQVLTGRFGVFEARAAGDALWRRGVEEIRSARHAAIEAAA